MRRREPPERPACDVCGAVGRGEHRAGCPNDHAAVHVRDTDDATDE